MKKVFVGVFIIAITCLSFQEKKNKKDLTFFIHLNFQNKPLVLNDRKYITINKDTVIITKLKFYLSNIILEMEDGTQYKESSSVHLVDA
ncbi:MAG: hypothetical protein RL108_1179, partial [Bacteroidota bacterium]